MCAVIFLLTIISMGLETEPIAKGRQVQTDSAGQEYNNYEDFDSPESWKTSSKQFSKASAFPGLVCNVSNFLHLICKLIYDLSLITYL